MVHDLSIEACAKNIIITDIRTLKTHINSIFSLQSKVLNNCYCLTECGPKKLLEYYRDFNATRQLSLTRFTVIQNCSMAIRLSILTVRWAKFASVIFRFFEIFENSFVVPAWVAKLRPPVVIISVPSVVHHEVNCAGASHYLPSREQVSLQSTATTKNTYIQWTKLIHALNRFWEEGARFKLASFEEKKWLHCRVVFEKNTRFHWLYPWLQTSYGIISSFSRTISVGLCRSLFTLLILKIYLLSWIVIIHICAHLINVNIYYRYYFDF